ncbi:MAG: hypothetical protein CVT74_01390 [Alphaproteobacteria bacterium HGW-Alphaproteobacteria-13]|jgi:DNA-binding FadR family transcriptional regulator|nr:MAG: hypothetical protein CVT74_01390 [Alphaproteobacteria bacterium HGW-Alphaproteobacteria-13]
MPTRQDIPAGADRRVDRFPPPFAAAMRHGDCIAVSLRAQIVRGQLAAGSHLPTEIELVRHYGYPRQALRDALRVLEAEGLIAVAPGARQGALIRSPSAERAARYAALVLQFEGTTAADLYDARMAFELDVIAAIEGGPALGAALRAPLADMAAALGAGDADAFAGAQKAFHDGLAGAARNQTILFFNEMLQALCAQHRQLFYQRWPQELARRAARDAAALDAYHKLQGLIAADEPAAAAEHWRRYLETANRMWTIDDGSDRAFDCVGSLG